MRAAEADQVPEEQPKSPLVTDAVLPILSAVEEECGQALSRISLDDIVNRATKNGGGIRRDEPSEHPAA